MRKKERKNRLVKNKKILLIVLFLIFFILIFSTIYVWLRVTNLSKFIVVSKTEDGGGEVLIVDSKTDSLKRYNIDPNLVLNGAYGYGEYKLSSLWTLGNKEGLGGNLVVKSISSNFLIPVYLWKDDSKSNINLYQKIKLKFISKHDQNATLKFESFDLPNSILINFLDNNIQESGVRVYVNDMTGDPEVISKVSSIVGTLGTKISGYSKGYDENLDCKLYGKEVEILEVFSNVFDCRFLNQTDSDEIKIELGAKFAERF